MANTAFRCGLHHRQPLTRQELKRRSKKAKRIEKWDLAVAGDPASHSLGYVDKQQFSEMVAAFKPLFDAYEREHSR